ncbi:MAG: winged helix-turn-helix domain-containing protein [Vulcanimicrobiaceae bacterium]
MKTHIANLRRKLRTAGCTDPIETVYGLGYRLSDLS